MTHDPRLDLIRKLREMAAGIKALGLPDTAQLMWDAASALEAQDAVIATYQQSLNLCAIHTPDLWEGDGTCVLCEADRLAATIKEQDAVIATLRAEQCICAAIKLPNGEVWRGHRHDNAIQVAFAAPDVAKADVYEAEQGFITSRNRFVGREEGARLQNAAGIVSASTLQPIGDMLFSEDLYLRDWRTGQPDAPRSEKP